ncbi:hypothetical protein DMR_36770 [Solidesulfovibrio magneticus RS-1]|uniref:Uncharacterized protein n=1 Tax=Solidesulfovibrio magneticus (strain ATCC 700980 / DSM 13731 / RS-1) TaxID=573370 RepID=C4XM40_SOLM1|nr:hypothetical protein DMR_36770 [Solidesulfovibrio magneticus RS-1]
MNRIRVMVSMFIQSNQSRKHFSYKRTLQIAEVIILKKSFSTFFYMSLMLPLCAFRKDYINTFFRMNILTFATRYCLNNFKRTSRWISNFTRKELSTRGDFKVITASHTFSPKFLYLNSLIR